MSSGMPPNPYNISTTQVPPQSGPPPNVPNYLVQAILLTVCCCIPFGIVAIVYSAQVNSKLATGNFSGAMESSKNAKKWCWIALIGGILGNLLVMVLYAIMVAVAVSQQQGM